MTRTASHARCAIVEPTAMMHVQNYAGSQINVAIAEKAPLDDWKYSRGWHEDLSALIVQQ